MICQRQNIPLENGLLASLSGLLHAGFPPILLPFGFLRWLNLKDEGLCWLTESEGSVLHHFLPLWGLWWWGKTSWWKNMEEGSCSLHDRGESEGGSYTPQLPLWEQACSKLETHPPTRPHLLMVSPPGSTIMRLLVVSLRLACLYPELFFFFRGLPFLF